MTPLGEDYTAGVLAGVPIFCINRHYVTGVPTTMHKIQYIFEFGNGYGASIVEFVDRMFSGEEQYELGVLDRQCRLCYDTGITQDVARGNDREMHRLLCEIELLNDAT